MSNSLHNWIFIGANTHVEYLAVKKMADFFGLEDLLDQACEDDVYSRLTPTYLK